MVYPKTQNQTVILKKNQAYPNKNSENPAYPNLKKT